MFLDLTLRRLWRRPARSAKYAMGHFRRKRSLQDGWLLDANSGRLARRDQGDCRPWHRKYTHSVHSRSPSRRLLLQRPDQDKGQHAGRRPAPSRQPGLVADGKAKGYGRLHCGLQAFPAAIANYEGTLKFQTAAVGTIQDTAGLLNLTERASGRSGNASGIHDARTGPAAPYAVAAHLLHSCTAAPFQPRPTLSTGKRKL